MLWRGTHVARSSLADGVPYQLPWSRGCPIVVDVESEPNGGPETSASRHLRAIA
jgi:hypothetical protein